METSSENLSGLVVEATTHNAKNGKTYYRFKINGDGRSFGLGETPHPFKEGDYISFQAYKKGAFWEAANAAISEAPSSGDTQVRKSNGKKPFPSQTLSKDQYWRNKEEKDVEKDKVIQLQSCRNSAIALTDVLVANDLVKLPAAAAKKYDAVLALVDELTQKFVQENRMNKDGESEEVPAVAPVEQDVEEELAKWS